MKSNMSTLFDKYKSLEETRCVKAPLLAQVQLLFNKSTHVLQTQSCTVGRGRSLPTVFASTCSLDTWYKNPSNGGTKGG